MVKPISAAFPQIKTIPSVPGSGNREAASGSLNFGEMLNSAINNVNQAQKASDQMSSLLAAGKIDDLHTVMIEGAKAELALQFTLQVRNKILDAYNEIMRMQM
ncbi:MAG: flagellar hook-basal body complex protein FliE [Deltaproteobacteria bacterium]